MNQFRAWGWSAAGPALAAVLVSTAPAGPYPYPDHTFYVTYWCPEWRETAPMDENAAPPLLARLARFGAEAKLIGKGVAVDDPAYPLQAFRMVSVRYRLTERKELITTRLGQAQRWQAELQSLGFDVHLSVDEPYRGAELSTGLPAPGGPAAGPSAARLPPHSEWAGVISQEGRSLPARLVLDRSGNDIRGELSFELGGRSYRAKVRGRIDGDKVLFTAYEAIEGRVYTPTEYQATLRGDTMKGEWRYAPEQLDDSFTFTIIRP